MHPNRGRRVVPLVSQRLSRAHNRQLSKVLTSVNVADFFPILREPRQERVAST